MKYDRRKDCASEKQLRALIPQLGACQTEAEVPRRAPSDKHPSARPTGAEGDFRSLMTAAQMRPRRFVQEPDPLFGLIDPLFEQACRPHILVLLAARSRIAKASEEDLIVLDQLLQHIGRLDKIRVVIVEFLEANDIPDRADGRRPTRRTRSASGSI